MSRNYTLVANNVFRNRSFEDLLKPLAMYTEEYNAIENAASDLATKASVWEGMANEEQDPIAYAQYKRYADDLQRQATQLANNGLTPGSRRDLLNLKKRYSSEITPIEQAYANRKAQADEQRKALLQNPTLLLSRRADMTSLDRYLDNPQLGYDSYSGALLTQQVGTAASAIAKELRDYGKGKPLDGFTKTWLQQHGFTAAEVAQAINNPDSPRSSQILNTLVNNVIADSGVPQWADRATLGQAYNYARQGLWQAVGQTQVQIYTDEAAKLAAQEASQKRVAQYTARLQNPQPDVVAGYHTRPVRTTTERAEYEKAKNEWNDYSKYFYKTSNGLWHMTSEGKKLYKLAQQYSKVPGESENSKMINPYPEITAASKAIENGIRPVAPAAERNAKQFMDFVDRMNINKMVNSKPGPWQSGVLDEFVARANNTYDTNTATETTRLIDSSDYKKVLSTVKTLAKDNELTNQERVKDGNSYRFRETNSKVDVSKLKESDIAYAQTVSGIHGSYLEVTFNDGTVVNIPQAYIDRDRSGIIEGLNNYAAELEKEKQAGKQYVQDSNGNIIPIDLAIVKARNSAHKNFLSGFNTSKVKESEIEEGLYR